MAAELDVIAEGMSAAAAAAAAATASGGGGGGRDIGNYQIIKTIGKGNFAKVKLAKHLYTGIEVAIKIIDKTPLNEASLKKLMREVRIMKMMDHPNIVKLFEVIDTESTLYLVMEYVSGGEIFDYLVAHGRMKEKEARAKFRQILSAVEYCHAHGVIHRDLKAENLLLDADMHVKIADFGFSNNYTVGDKLDTFCGSPPYAAPELFQGKKYDGPEVDVWSLGVILYTLVAGSLPFDGTNLKELRERVLRGKYRIPFFMSTECEQLLKRFLVITPAKRTDLTSVLSHKWINMGHEDAPLEPHVNPPPDYSDDERFNKMKAFGFDKSEVLEALTSDVYNHMTATYLLLGRAGAQQAPKTASHRKLRSSASAGAASAVAAHVAAEGGGGGGGGAGGRARSSTSQGIPVGTISSAGSGSGSGANPRRRRHSTTVSSSSSSGGDGAALSAKMAAAKISGGGGGGGGKQPKSGDVGSSSSGGGGGSRRHSVAITPGGGGGGGGGDMGAGVFAATDGAGGASAASSAAEDEAAGGGDQGSFLSKMRRGLKTSFRRGSLGGGGRSSMGGGGPPKPRSLRFTFSANNTSSKEADELLESLKRVLEANHVEFSQLEPFALQCTRGQVQFEMEIIRLPRLAGMNGIRHKRIAGESLAYKNICTKLLNEVNL